MRNQLRLIAVLCVVAPLAAMAFEPFFSALLARLGWDSEAWVDPMLSTVSSMVSHPWFPIVATGLIAFGLGVLLDFAAKGADSLLSRLVVEKRNVTETDHKKARERLLERALEAIRSALKDIEVVRPFLEEKFADRVDVSDDERKELVKFVERWNDALCRIESSLQACSQDVHFVLVNIGYRRGLHPLQGYGTDLSSDEAKEVRLFWDQATAFDHQFPEAFDRIKMELTDVRRRLDRLGGR